MSRNIQRWRARTGRVIGTLITFAAMLAASQVIAAQCEVLPYANQCQGSNLWPVPAGWGADSNGDCQPEPPSQVDPLLFRSNACASPVETCALKGLTAQEICAKHDALVDAWVCASWNEVDKTYVLTVGSSTYNYYLLVYLCPDGYSPGSNHKCSLDNPGSVTKPSDGICTQRKMPDGSLQQDPLDPDCAGVTQCTDAGKNLGAPPPSCNEKQGTPHVAQEEEVRALIGRARSR